MLEAVALTCVRGGRLLFRDLSFGVEPGCILWVCGHNGSGKTSLLRLLCGLAHPATGVVRWNGSEIHREREEFQKELVYLGHLNALKDDLTPGENLGFVLQQPGAAPAIARQLRERGLAMYLDLPTRVLSQGQKRRVALTRLALSRARKLWVLDEPFAALDAPAIEDLTQLITAQARAGGMVVLTSHQEVGLGDVPVTRLRLAGGSLPQ